MLQPKRVKFRKTHKGRRSGAAHAGATLAFGEFALQATGSAWMTARQALREFERISDRPRDAPVFLGHRGIFHPVEAPIVQMVRIDK